MATELATAYISLVPSFKGIQGEIARGLSPVTGEADKAGRRSGKAFGGGMKAGVGKIAGLLGAGFAAVKVKDFLGDAIGEARESQKVAALTTQVIKSTGGAANVTAKQVGNLASAISNKTGIDDQAIQTGANLLLTFKNVRNEAGKGNKVFDQATQAAIDLSAAGFGSIDSASKQLGKALNDPINGIAALGRSGVTFTEDQKKLIKGFVEQGDMLSAQKIILGEVKSQVGGAAEASATAGEKLAVSWGNFKETIGTALLPIIDKLATFLSEKLLPGMVALGPEISKVAKFVKSFFSGFNRDTDGAGSKFAQFRTTIMQVWTNVKTIFTSGVSIIQSLWARFGGTLTAFLQGTLSNILLQFRGIFNVIAGVFKTFAALLKGDWQGVWDGIKQILRGAVQLVVALVRQLWLSVKSIFKIAGSAIKGVFTGIWNGLVSLARAGIAKVVDAIRAVPGKIRALGSSFKSAGKSVLNALLDGLKGGAGFVSDIAGKIWNAVKGMLNKAIDKINAALEFRIDTPGPGGININPPNIGHLAKGTNYWRGGPTWVGEDGPEILNLRRGSSVTSHKDSIAATSSKGGDVHLHVTAPAGLNEPELGRVFANQVLWAMS